jgi:hypothetical protein
MSSIKPESGKDVVNTLAPKEPGAPAADDHDKSGPPSDAVIKRGYEEDRYDATSVISVPILVVVFFILAFGVVTVIFRFIREPGVDPSAHPMAVERNAPSLNDRMGRIHRGGEIDQPRLEPLKLRDTRGGDSRAITRPELPEGNSPELHPEDLRPSPEHTPALFQRGWNDATKTAARVTIDDAMTLSLTTLNAKFFPKQKDGTVPAESTEIPTGSNGGSTARLPAKKEEHKHP